MRLSFLIDEGFEFRVSDGIPSPKGLQQNSQNCLQRVGNNEGTSSVISTESGRKRGQPYGARMGAIV